MNLTGRDRLVMALLRIIAKVLGKEAEYDAELARSAGMSADEMRRETSAKLAELQKMMAEGWPKK